MRAGSNARMLADETYLKLGEERGVGVQEDHSRRCKPQLVVQLGAGGIRAVPRKQLGNPFCFADVGCGGYARLSFSRSAEICPDASATEREGRDGQ